MDEERDAKFPSTLARILEQRDLSPGELAQVVGLDRTGVWRLVKGLHKPRMATAIRIADALGMPIDQIFGETKEEEGAL